MAPYSEAIGQVANNLLGDLISLVDRECAVLITSYICEQCEENCPSPAGFCPVTRRPKPAPMFKLLEFSVFELVDFVKVFMSKQLGPGVG